MDYEKKYNEALKRAKAAIDIAADKDLVKGVATTIFPELRESEDERVIRTLYYLVRDHDWLNGATKEEALAWLEKQKESLPIPETCKENAEYFQCGDNRFELIDKAKRDIIAKTNIESSPDEMKVLDSFLFRALQMGWLGKYDVIVPEQKVPDCCLKCNEYEIGYKAGYEHGCTAGYNKAMKEVGEQKGPENTSASVMAPSCWGVEQQEQKPVVTHGETYRVDTLGTQQVIAGKMPQKPAEWSEEDEEIFNNIIEKAKGGHWIEVNEITWLINRFKSLRPSWKPREEQMEALLWCIAHLGGADRRVLAELYEHLKMYCK